jgi:hypothetical protein
MNSPARPHSSGVLLSYYPKDSPLARCVASFTRIGIHVKLDFFSPIQNPSIHFLRQRSGGGEF